MNECETVLALVNVSVQSSLVFLRHYKLHLSLAQSHVNAGSLLSLLLLLTAVAAAAAAIAIEVACVC